MNLFNEYLLILNSGGFIFYLLILLSIYTTSIVIYKVVQFINTKNLSADFLNRANNKEKLLKLAEELKKQDITNIPCAKILLATINCFLIKKHDKSFAYEEVKLISKNSIARLKIFLKSLSLAQHISPMLGILGAVSVGITNFSQLEKAGGSADFSKIAGIIWLCLLPIFVGFFIAIIASISNFFLKIRIEEIEEDMHDIYNRVITIIDSDKKIYSGVSSTSAFNKKPNLRR